jgi:hypothetical protein
MEVKIFVFWAVVYLLIWLLKRRPNSVVTRAAFTWVGPVPAAGQSWATFQLRWAFYSFGWLCQFAVVFSFLFVIVQRYPRAPDSFLFQLLMFAVPIGAGMAALATIGFLVKAAKARLFGPNPTCVLPSDALRA